MGCRGGGGGFNVWVDGGGKLGLVAMLIAFFNRWHGG